MVYRQATAFHPERLWDLLHRLDSHGVLRSKGFLWTATRPAILALWSQAGPTGSCDPVAIPIAAGGPWPDWDEHQETHLPGREQCFDILLDVIAAVSSDRPARVLDLAGGIGSLSRRILAAHPDADITLLDVDPLALAVAHAELGEAIAYCPADLRDPTWTLNLRPETFDAVLTTTSLHSLPGPRIQQLYREISTLLRPGGVLVNATRCATPCRQPTSTRRRPGTRRQ